MTSRLQEAMTRLSTRMADTSGVTITYRRGTVSRDMTAVVGKFTFAVDPEEYGGQLYTHSRDFIIKRSVFEEAGFSLPVRGDKITHVDDTGDSRTYEVLAPNGEQPWRWSDEYHQAMRVHSKIITSEDPT